MMLLVFTLLTLAGLVGADPTKPGCCVPPTWTGLQGSIVGQVPSGNPRVINENVMTYYDEPNQKIGLRVFTDINGQQQRLQVIQDFSKGIQYVFDEDTQICEKYTIANTFQKMCLPLDAIPQGPFYFGIGNTELQSISFRLYVAGNNVTVVSLPEGCIPVLEVLTTADGGSGPQMQTTGFVNLRPGISDPSVFNVPAACTKAEVVEGGSNIFKRRGVFSL